MKPEQRVTRDENHTLEMPRQGVSFLNDMLAILTFNEVVTVNFLRFIRCDQCYPNIVIDHELG